MVIGGTGPLVVNVGVDAPVKRIFFLHRFVRNLVNLERGYTDSTVIDDALYQASRELFNTEYGSSAADKPAVGQGRAYQKTRAVSEALHPFLRQQKYTTNDAENLANGTFALTNGKLLFPDDCAHATDLEVPTAEEPVRFPVDNQLTFWLKSKINRPTAAFPICAGIEGGYQLYPQDTPEATLKYLSRPPIPKYAIQKNTAGEIVIGEDGEPAYDNFKSVDTGWLPEQENELLWRALQILGVPIRDGVVQQFAQFQTQKGS